MKKGKEKGWKGLEVDDSFLLGGTDGGFAGIEVLEDASIIESLLMSYQQEGDEKDQHAKAKKGKKQAVAAADKPSKKRKLQDVSKDEDEIATLKARLALLEQENKKLKKSKVVDPSEEKKEEEKKEGEKGPNTISKKTASRMKRAQILERMKQKRQERKEQNAKAKQVRAESAKEAEKEAEDRPLSDVTAWKKFSLHSSLERALALKGFESPTEIQEATLAAAITGRRDVIGAAQTGSGKTLAFGLPILQVLLEERENSEADKLMASSSSQGVEGEAVQQGKLRALILTPTRELALQVCQHLQALGKECGIRVAAIVGGLAQVKQERALSQHPEIVIATPGRLWELMKAGQAHLADLGLLSFLVLDEADRMVQQGHYQELGNILELIPKSGEGRRNTYDSEFSETLKLAEERAKRSAGKKKGGGEQEDDQAVKASSKSYSTGHFLQTLVFSATLTLPNDLRKRLRKGGGGGGGGASLESLMERISFRGEPEVVDLTTARRVASSVEESHIQCTEEERDELLYYLLAKHPGRTLVFVNAISSVRRVSAILKVLGLPAWALHAQQQQRQRLKAVDKFRAHEQGVLVATDVAARGLDIKGIRCVIHYQLPASVDTYIHRSGRTARAGEDGISICLVTPKEAPRWNALCRAMSKEQQPPTFPVDRTLMPQVHKRMRLAMKLDDFLRAERKKRAENNWARNNADAIGVDQDDNASGPSAAEEGESEEEEEGGGKGGKVVMGSAAKALHAQLSMLLAAPLTPKISSKYLTGGAMAAVAHGAGMKAAHAPVKKGGTEEHSVVPAETVNRAVAIANQLQESKNMVKEAGKGKGKKDKGKGKKNMKGQKVLSMCQRADLMVSKNELKKRNGGKPKLTVIPPSFSREAQGSDALSALRKKMGP